jgi:hypothetical protein
MPQANIYMMHSCCNENSLFLNHNDRTCWACVAKGIKPSPIIIPSNKAYGHNEKIMNIIIVEK